MCVCEREREGRVDVGSDGTYISVVGHCDKICECYGTSCVQTIWLGLPWTPSGVRNR